MHKTPINATWTQLLCATLITFFSMNIYSGEVYKWVDEHGNINYSDKRPNNVESKSIRIRNNQTKPQASSQAKALDEKQARAAQAQNEKSKDAAREKEIEAKCKVIRENLKIIAETSRVRVEEKGQLRYLSTEEIQAKKARHEEQLKEFCQ